MDSLRQPRNLRRDRPAPTGFDFTGHIRLLCEDMTTRLEQLRHIDMSRVAIGFAQTRLAGSQGLHATLSPMRFAGGRLHLFRRKRRWGMQRLFAPDGREMLYILTFYLPRFLDLPFREKLTTVLHELWHIGPKFDGDLRRLGGRCHAHGPSQKQYDAHMETLLDRWLSLDPPDSIYDFLRRDYQELSSLHGRVWGSKIPSPKLIPLD
ncbi:MAG: hypothetical protein JW959_04690 [Pirellulales bacterium]|nr:hypothetical protein [Pirellulales bacterium]